MSLLSQESEELLLSAKDFLIESLDALCGDFARDSSPVLQALNVTNLASTWGLGCEFFGHYHSRKRRQTHFPIVRD